MSWSLSQLQQVHSILNFFLIVFLNLFSCLTYISPEHLTGICPENPSISKALFYAVNHFHTRQVISPFKLSNILWDYIGMDFKFSGNHLLQFKTTFIYLLYFLKVF